MEENDAKPKAENTQNLVEELYFGTSEKTVATSAYHTDSFIKPYNPDDLWQKTGDFSIYEEMKNDDQVNVALQLKTDLVIGSGWSLVTEDGDSTVADDITRRLEEDPEVAFDDQLEELIDSAFTYGFGLSEKIFKLRGDQSLTLKELKTRHPDTWLIHTDDRGNITKYIQRGAQADVEINPKSLMHYVNNRRYQNPYGTSDLRACYQAYFVKRHIIRYYSIFLEKYASPTPYAKYDPNVPANKVEEMFNILKKFQTKTAMVFPKNFEVDFLQSSSNGDAYIRGINLFNMFIGRSLLIPDLLGFQGDETSGGSYSLGKEQMDLFFKHIRRRRSTLERMINKHIIQPLVVWNHGQVEHFPKFVFNPINDEHALDFAKTFLDAVKGKVYKPSEEEINHFRHLIKFPEGEVEVAEAPATPEEVKPEDDKTEEEIEEVETEEIEEIKEDEEGNFSKKFVFSETSGDYSKKVNFKALEKQLSSTKDKIVSQTDLIMDEIFEDLTKQIERKKILLGNGKPERIESLKIKKLAALKQVIKKSLKGHFLDSKLQARNELFKRSFAEPLPSEAFLKLLDQETFEFVGDWEYTMNKKTRLELIKALKDGTPMSKVLTTIKNDIRKLGATSIERYARTKSTEVMNRARVEEFTESGAVDGFQYSAIMDDRTTAICSGLHGKKFKVGDEPIPPMHFNCRSVLIPITIFEEFTPDEKVGKTNIDTFIDDNKGEGFAKR